MAHPFAGQAKSSESARLKRLTGSPGKAWGSSKMYKAKSYPSKGAGTEREFTISGGKGKNRPDRLASGGVVGKKRRPHATTNIIISHAGGRGGTGGGGGAGGQPSGPVPVPINRPVPVPVGAGGPPVPGGGPPQFAGPRPMPVMPPRPPMAGPPPGPPVGPMPPPGMKKGGSVKKAANGGGVGGKAYRGFPYSPTTEVDDAVSAHKKGGGVKKLQFGGGSGMGSGVGGGGPATGQGLVGLLGQNMPGRAPQGPIQGPPNISGRPYAPGQPLTVPQPKLATSMLQRPAPGPMAGPAYKKGGAVHDDEAQDRKLFKRMIKQEDQKEKAEKRARGGSVNPGSNQTARGLSGSVYHQQGKGFAAGGLVKTPLKNTTGGGAGGKGRLAKTRAAKSVPDKTEL